MESSANQDLGLSAFNFTYSSYISASVSFRHQSKTNTNRCTRVKEQPPCSTHKLKYGNRVKDWQIPNKFVSLSNDASLLMTRDKSCRQSNEASRRHPTSQSKTVTSWSSDGKLVSLQLWEMGHMAQCSLILQCIALCVQTVLSFKRARDHSQEDICKRDGRTLAISKLRSSDCY